MTSESCKTLVLRREDCAPALGNAYIPNEMVTRAVDALIQRMMPIYSEMVKKGEVSKEWNLYNEFKICSTKNTSLENERCHIRLNIKITELKNGDDLDLLLLEIMKRIHAFGYKDDDVFDVRLEKGYLAQDANFWHFDERFKASVTICFSNRENWSTRVLDLKKVSEFGDIESNGKPARHGYFYNALQVYHRAPIASDLGGQELAVNDYRLFVRYKA